MGSISTTSSTGVAPPSSWCTAWAGSPSPGATPCAGSPGGRPCTRWTSLASAPPRSPARAAYLATLRHVRTDFEVHAEDYRRAIATLDLPVLLIHGRQDRVVPSAHCALVAEGFAHATVRWVDECGHFPQIEQAETVNRWLVDFLVGRPAPR